MASGWALTVTLMYASDLGPCAVMVWDSDAVEGADWVRWDRCWGGCH